MTAISRLTVLLCCALMTGALARAQGSPPFTTDDTGTTAPGSLECCVAVSVDSARSGDRTWTVPSVDVAYGLTKTLEIGYGVPLLLLKPEEGSSQAGLGDSVVGAKWRFLEDAAGWSASVGPQVAFNNPTPSRRRGLVDNNTELLLPFQLQTACLGCDFWLNAGRSFHARERRESDAWLGGVAMGRKLSARCYGGAEVYGESSRSFGRSCAVFSVGVQHQLSDAFILYSSIGRGIAGADRPDYTGLLGVQYVR